MSWYHPKQIFCIYSPSRRHSRILHTCFASPVPRRAHAAPPVFQPPALQQRSPPDAAMMELSAARWLQPSCS